MEEEKNTFAAISKSTLYKIPEGFKCALTGKLMHNPVMVTTDRYGSFSFNGYSYEQSEILQWLKEGKDTNPQTGEKLTPVSSEHKQAKKFQAKDLIPNHTLKSAIAEFKKNHPTLVDRELITNAELFDSWFDRQLEIHSLEQQLKHLHALRNNVELLDTKSTPITLTDDTTSEIPEAPPSISSKDAIVLEIESLQVIPPLTKQSPKISPEDYGKAESFFRSAQKKLELEQYDSALLLSLHAAKLRYPYAFLLLIDIYSLSPGPRYNLANAELATKMALLHSSEIQKTAIQGDATAQFYLAITFEMSGNYGMTFYWLEKAEAQGYALATLKLGICFQSGIGVEKDLNRAVTYFRKACVKNSASAHYRLGLCYEKGDGVEKNSTTAMDFFHKAATQGHRSALFKCGVYCHKQKKLPETITYMQRAANIGHAGAQQFLGNFYNSKKKPQLAFYWHQQAREHGNKEAAAKIQALSQKYPAFAKSITENLPTGSEPTARDQSHSETLVMQEVFSCSIDKELMRIPTSTSYGHSYSAEAISLWLERRSTDPLTNEPVKKLLIYNVNIAQAIFDIELQTTLRESIAMQQSSLEMLKAQIESVNTDSPSSAEKLPVASSLGSSTFFIANHEFSKSIHNPSIISDSSTQPSTESVITTLRQH